MWLSFWRCGSILVEVSLFLEKCLSSWRSGSLLGDVAFFGRCGSLLGEGTLCRRKGLCEKQMQGGEPGSNSEACKLYNKPKPNSHFIKRATGLTVLYCKHYYSMSVSP